MILPSKHLTEDRSLLYVGGEVLCLLDRPKTVSRLWGELKKMRGEQEGMHAVTFDWFVLALDFLFAIGAINTDRDRIRRTAP